MSIPRFISNYILIFDMVAVSYLQIKGVTYSLSWDWDGWSAGASNIRALTTATAVVHYN